MWKPGSRKMPLLHYNAVILAMLACLSLIASSTTYPINDNNKKPYIVLMDSTKTLALDYSLNGTKRWYEQVLHSLHLPLQEQPPLVGPPELLYVYESSLSGFAAKLSDHHLKTLRKIDGFLSAFPDEISIGIHTTYSPHFLSLAPGRGLWSSENLAADVIIGIVDTGIWPEHVSFADSDNISGVPARWKGACESGVMFSPESCGKKLIGARAFWKGYEAIAGVINETREFRSARDSQGHGTHTASTAGGNSIKGASLFGNAAGTARGMRFTAKVAVYKACWDAGCTSSDILAAVDRAVADGVDVLSLSLGSAGSRSYYSDSIAIAALGAVEKGVFVACSAGNSGPRESTVSNVAPWITTVAASYTNRRFPTTVKLGDGRSFTGASLYTGKPTKKLRIVYGRTAGGDSARYCIEGSLSPKLVRGKIVICERSNSRAEKGEQAKLAGAAGMLLLNAESDGEELFADPHLLPASSVGFAAASAIKGYILSSKNSTASIKFHGTDYGNPASAIAAFSSRGPSLAGPDILKPDIAAPGMGVLAAWPPTVSPSLLDADRRRVEFNVISGTSMSCPHVSGVAALLKSAHPYWSPAAIKSAIMTTARTRSERNSTIIDISTGMPATPFAAGSGYMDPEGASRPGLIYDITPRDYLDYICSLNYTAAQRAVLARKRYGCRGVQIQRSGDLNYPSFSVTFGGGSKSAESFRTATNVGPAGCRYSVSVREPRGVMVVVEPKVMTFARAGEKMSYKVTFVRSAGGGGGGSSFGEVVWVCGEFSVRSPIAVSWQ